MTQIITKETLAEKRERWEFADGVNLAELVDVGNLAYGLDEPFSAEKGKRVNLAEFIGTGDFAAQFIERQRYEVDAGRDQEPLLYQPIYEEIVDSNLPEAVTLYLIGPGGVVFEQVTEGGEVKFVTVGESEQTVRINQFAAGVEYTKRLFIFNQTWNVSIVERQAGIAYNALLNHLHLNPFIAYSYGAANQTAASAVGATLEEKYLRTIEDAIVAAQADTTNPRRGPYDLLVASGDRFTVERALFRVGQQGFSKQSSAIDEIRNVIVYNGWSGTRGKQTTSYDGVTAGTAYLISSQYAFRDTTSWVKQGLQAAQGNADVSRFIQEQTVWDTFMGVYCNVLRTTEEITWPTS